MSPAKGGILQLIGVANLIVGVVLLIFSIPFFYHQQMVLKTWLTTDAQVLHSDVVIETLSGHEQLYSAKLGLLYTVGGEPITAELTSFQDHNYKKTLDRANEFAVGSHHEIRYDPHNPSQARIGAGWNRRYFALPLIIASAGVFFLLVAVGLFAATKALA